MSNFIGFPDWVKIGAKIWPASKVRQESLKFYPLTIIKVLSFKVRIKSPSGDEWDIERGILDRHWRRWQSEEDGELKPRQQKEDLVKKRGFKWL
jgi:hypothetical protein